LNITKPHIIAIAAVTGTKFEMSAVHPDISDLVQMSGDFVRGILQGSVCMSNLTPARG
jgi:hypothetical protein